MYVGLNHYSSKYYSHKPLNASYVGSSKVIIITIIITSFISLIDAT